jgi:TldD protein
LERDWSGTAGKLPDSVSTEEKLARLAAIRDRGLKASMALVDFRISYEEVVCAKLFVSPLRQLNQAYVWSQGYLVPIAQKDDRTRYYYQSYSGLKGPELLDEMEVAAPETVTRAESLLAAEAVKPGEYDVILSPDVAGLVAHEAFGHGVELDMFVKQRARAAEYLDKPVASPIVGMRDGARSAQHVSSYFFDDEGCLGTDLIFLTTRAAWERIPRLSRTAFSGTAYRISSRQWR